MLVLDTWLPIKDSTSDPDRSQRVFQTLTQLLPDVENVNTENLQNRIYSLCSRLKTYWQKVNRTRARLIENYSDWLNKSEVCSLSASLSAVTCEQVHLPAASDGSTSGFRHRKEFADCNKRSQRRRIATFAR